MDVFTDIASTMNAHAIIKEKRLTPDELTQAGSILYGKQWQSELARSLEVDSRRVRDWLQGRRPVPIGVKWEIIDLLKSKSIEANEYATELFNRFKE